MAGLMPYKRHKLRAHDNGIDRHNKGVAHLRKVARLAREHAWRRRRSDPPAVEELEAGSLDPHGPNCVCRACCL